jgi:hypothetical protein
MASCPEIEPTEFRLELVVPSWLPAELVTPVCVERTGRWPWSRSRTRCSRCVWPSGRPSIATHQPAESFVGDHHIARGFSLALAVALVRGAAVRSVDLARERGLSWARPSRIVCSLAGTCGRPGGAPTLQHSDCRRP